MKENFVKIKSLAKDPDFTGGIHFCKNDGGRSKYFKGTRYDDCVVRSIAIATQQDYREVFEELSMRALEKGLTYNEDEICQP